MGEPWSFSAAVLSKARDYLAHGRVERDEQVPGIWWVSGTDPSRRYRVQTDADPVSGTASIITCTCPHGLKAGAGACWCSHAAAVLMLVRDEHDAHRRAEEQP